MFKFGIRSYSRNRHKIDYSTFTKNVTPIVYFPTNINIQQRGNERLQSMGTKILTAPGSNKKSKSN